MNPRYGGARDGELDPRFIKRIVGVAILLFAIVVLFSAGTYVVQPGSRGVAVTLGTVSPEFKPEGFGLKKPFLTHVYPISIRQQTRPMPAECYSSDLQQVKMEVHVLYRIPEASVVKIFQEYAGEPFDNLIAPRVQEALKEVAATQSAEQIVKRREQTCAAQIGLLPTTDPSGQHAAGQRAPDDRSHAVALRDRQYFTLDRAIQQRVMRLLGAEALEPSPFGDPLGLDHV